MKVECILNAVDDYSCTTLGISEVGIVTGSPKNLSLIRSPVIGGVARHNAVYFIKQGTWGRPEDYRFRRLIPGEQIIISG